MILNIHVQDEIERQGSILVDYSDLIGDKVVRRVLPDITTQLKEQPELMLNCLGLAIHQVTKKKQKNVRRSQNTLNMNIANTPNMVCWNISCVSGVDGRFGKAGLGAAGGRTSCCFTVHQHPLHQCKVMNDDFDSFILGRIFNCRHCKGRTPVLLFIYHRLYNYEPLTPLRMLRASVFGRLVCVKGTVVRVGNIRPRCTRMAFKCLGCSNTQSLPLQHGKYATPTKVGTTTQR